MAAINLGMRRWRPRPQSASTPTISPSWFFTTRFGAVMWPTHLGEQMHRAPVALQVAILPLLGRRRWLRLDVGS